LFASSWKDGVLRGEGFMHSWWSDGDVVNRGDMQDDKSPMIYSRYLGHLILPFDDVTCGAG